MTRRRNAPADRDERYRRTIARLRTAGLTDAELAPYLRPTDRKESK